MKINLTDALNDILREPPNGEQAEAVKDLLRKSSELRSSFQRMLQNYVKNYNAVLVQDVKDGGITDVTPETDVASVNMRLLEDASDIESKSLDLFHELLDPPQTGGLIPGFRLSRDSNRSDSTQEVAKAGQLTLLGVGGYWSKTSTKCEFHPDDAGVMPFIGPFGSSYTVGYSQEDGNKNAFMVKFDRGINYANEAVVSFVTDHEDDECFFRMCAYDKSKQTRIWQLTYDFDRQRFGDWEPVSGGTMIPGTSVDFEAMCGYCEHYHTNHIPFVDCNWTMKALKTTDLFPNVWNYKVAAERIMSAVREIY